MATPHRRLSGISASLTDLLLLLAFVAVGRLSHGEDLSAGGLFLTWWPFAIGAAVGWTVCYAMRLPVSRILSGIVIAISTVVVGMLLRTASGQGVATSFIVVATCFVTLFLLSWRLIVAWLRGRSARRA